MEAKKGQIVSLNPNTVKNFYIPDGIVVAATPENLEKYKDMIDAYQKSIRK